MRQRAQASRAPSHKFSCKGVCRLVANRFDLLDVRKDNTEVRHRSFDNSRHRRVYFAISHGGRKCDTHMPWFDLVEVAVQGRKIGKLITWIRTGNHFQQQFRVSKCPRQWSDMSQSRCCTGRPDWDATERRLDSEKAG